MADKCPSCDSCGMPLEKPADYALGDVTRPYCSYCTDARGQLLSYEQVLETNTRYYVESQGISAAAAQRMAEALLADKPAWRGRH
jgi:hypothetical protein